MITAVWLLIWWALLLAVIAGRAWHAHSAHLGREMDPPPDPPAAPPARFTVLDGQTPFWAVEASCAPFRVKPYDYWRDRWIKTGDTEALEQMKRFTEEEQ